MEKLANLREYVDELVKCPICLSDLINPKSLPCLHTFCLHCLQDHCKDKLPGCGVDCPICRSRFMIPEKGINQLASNFFIKGLTDAKNAAGKSADSMLCDICCEFDELVPAVIYCTTCLQKMCDRCNRTHQKMPGTHQIVPLGNEVRDSILRSQGSFCSIHTGNKLEMYCNECHKNICVTCHATKHKKHDCEDINDIYMKFRRTVEDDIQQVLKKEQDVMSELNQLKTARRETMDKYKQTEDDITKTADEVKQHLDETVSTLMRQLTSDSDKATKVFSDSSSQLEFKLSALQSFCRYSQELVKSSNPCDITHDYKELHQRAAELLKYQKSDACYSTEITVSPETIFERLCEFISNKSSGEYKQIVIS